MTSEATSDGRSIERNNQHGDERLRNDERDTQQRPSAVATASTGGGSLSDVGGRTEAILLPSF